MKQTKKKVLTKPQIMTEVYIRFKKEVSVEEVQQMVMGFSMTLPPELDKELLAIKISHAIFDWDKAPVGEIFRREEVKDVIDKSYIG